MMKYGFIGGGKMAQALIQGLVKGGTAPSEIAAADPSEAVRNHLAETFKGIQIHGSAKDLPKARIVVLAVKPQVLPGILEEAAPFIDPKAVVLSLAPGITLERLRGCIGDRGRLVRVMPNTPALIGEGASGFCCGDRVSDKDRAEVVRFLESCGIAEPVSEAQMDGVVAVSGSAPAYVFLMIEAMADAAVKEGLPRDTAQRLAAQTVKGAAQMVLDTDLHPGVLKDQVCSPGGTTIEAMAVLRQEGFAGSLMKAMSACAEKSRSF